MKVSNAVLYNVVLYTISLWDYLWLYLLSIFENCLNINHFFKKKSEIEKCTIIYFCNLLKTVTLYYNSWNINISRFCIVNFVLLIVGITEVLFWNIFENSATSQFKRQLIICVVRVLRTAGFQLCGFVCCFFFGGGVLFCS